ncbi:hypothetical protein MJL48_32330, partial [Salmonella enterica subsp. enterica serovar Kentucky]|nr:hypothetical protein [Salmonella enterica subsp. enterica serovar Kentucky]
AQALSARGVELLSTGGTARLLAEKGLPVTEVSDYTGFPEMMDLAVGVTAGQTAIRLGFRLTFRKRFVDFNKLDLTDLQRFLRRI